PARGPRLWMGLAINFFSVVLSLLQVNKASCAAGVPSKSHTPADRTLMRRPRRVASATIMACAIGLRQILAEQMNATECIGFPECIHRRAAGNNDVRNQNSFP